MPPLTGIWTRLTGGVTALGVGAASRDAIEPVLEVTKQQAWARRALKILPINTAAQAYAQGIDRNVDYGDDAKRQGIGRNRWLVYRDLAQTFPGPSELLDLWRRDPTLSDETHAALRRQGYSEDWSKRIERLRDVILSGDDLAQMAVQGVVGYDVARDAAARAGTSAQTFDRLYHLHGDPIAPDQALDLWNRKVIGEPEVDTALRQSRLKPEWVDRFKALRRYLIPPSDTIRLAVREVYDAEKRAALDLDAEFPPAFAEKAALLGISESDARDLWAGHWTLPSYTQGANMMFRGEKTPAEFEELLAALDYAPTWRKPLAAIARAIPTLSDFVRFSVREVFDPAQRKSLDLDKDYPPALTKKAALHGLAEDDARDYWAAHWQLPSPTQGFHMLWRGEIDEPGLAGLLKALDYAPTWRGKLANIARPTLGRIDIRRAFHAGLITHAQGVELYGKLGYTTDNANLMLQLAGVGTASTSKDLTLTQLTSEYERGMIDAAEFRTEVEALGYDAAEADTLAKLAERKRVDRAREQAIATIRTAYVGHRLREPEARAALAERGVPAAAVDAVFVEWNSARAANVKVLTAANLKALYKAATISRDEALAELTFRGYSDADAARLVGTWE